MSKPRRKKTKALLKGSAGTGADRPVSERQFVEGLAIRGEAAKADEGALPSGATHEIVEENEDEIIVKRRRFSTY